MWKKSLVIIFVCFCALFRGSLVAQEPMQDADVVPSTEENVDLTDAERARRLKSLSTVLTSLQEQEKNLREKQDVLGSPSARGREEKLLAEIAKIQESIDALERSFNVVATTIETEEAGEQTEQFSWAKEARDLLEPLITEIKRLTSRPREINSLRTRLELFRSEKAQAEYALENIEELTQGEVPEDLSEALKALESQWLERKQSVLTDISVAQQKLNRKLSEKKSFYESIKDVSQIFFRSRGRNLLVAILATILFWVLIRYLQRRFDRFGHTKTFSSRLVHVLFFLAYMLGTLGVFVFVLFVFGDWVLLILAMLAIVGLVLASKQAIPLFWTQIMLLLDMSTVREGERIEYKGLPWKVLNLNFYSDLVNPALEGGTIRLPLKDFTELRSRPYSKSEPWFPTERGDWVLLPDDQYGQIARQTPEVVELESKGGARTYFPSKDFLALAPTVLSHGFRINTTFGVDYGLQASVTSGVVEMMKKQVVADLESYGYDSDLVKVNVEFSRASESSLDLAVITDFKGSCAESYQVLTRLVQRICVDACNENGWVIPFNQLTVHVNQ